MTERLFAYGTLMFPSIMRAVTGLDRVGTPAKLCGYRRQGVRGTLYPGIVPAPGFSTAGVLYDRLDTRILKRLDRFEGSLYRRSLVIVHDPAGLASRAWTYVIRSSHAQRLDGRDWPPERFGVDGLSRFRHAYAGFKEGTER